MHIVSTSYTKEVVSSSTESFSHTTSDVICSKTKVLTHIYLPTDEVAHVMEIMKDGPMHIFLNGELVNVYVSDTKMVFSPHAIIVKDESEYLELDDAVFI